MAIISTNLTKIGQNVEDIQTTLGDVKTLDGDIVTTVSNKLDKTGDSTNVATSFTSNDTTEEVTTWTDVAALTSGEKHSSIFNKISTMFKNIKYLYKLLGTTDISKIGDGTVTNALSTIDSDLTNFMSQTSMSIKGIIVENLIPCPYYTKSGMHTNGVTFTYGEDGVIYANGTTTAIAFFMLTDKVVPDYHGTVTLSIDSNDSKNVSVFYAHYDSDGTNLGEYAVRQTDGSVTFNMWTDEYSYTRIGVYLTSGVTFDNIPIKVQVESGHVAHSYSPYNLSRHSFRNDLKTLPVYKSNTLENGSFVAVTVKNGIAHFYLDLYPADIPTLAKYSSGVLFTLPEAYCPITDMIANPQLVDAVNDVVGLQGCAIMVRPSGDVDLVTRHATISATENATRSYTRMAYVLAN